MSTETAAWASGETAVELPGDYAAEARGDGELAAPDWYDRSSLDGDYLVALEGQSPDDWERRAPESRFCEYIDGVVYMPSPVSDRHQLLVQFLFELINGVRLAGRCGEVLLGPAVLRLSWMRKVEPDIFVRSMKGAENATAMPSEVLASLVVEVLSPSNREHELVRKAKLYQDAGIPEV